MCSEKGSDSKKNFSFTVAIDYTGTSLVKKSLEIRSFYTLLLTVFQKKLYEQNRVRVFELALNC